MRHPRRARLGASLVALALTPLVASCGEDSFAAYCGAVSDHQDRLTRALTGSGDAFDALPVLRDLRDKAPDDVRADWNQVVSALEGLRSALDDAGVDPQDYDPAHPPAGLSAEAQARIKAAADTLDSPATTEASVRVQQEVRDVCHTPLTL